MKDSFKGIIVGFLSYMVVSTIFALLNIDFLPYAIIIVIVVVLYEAWKWYRKRK
ncbi:hypothetical protein R9X47_18390 [Wukongibacter baidiensis]|uniref:hypothetical protein n=1 Tax=Wukongibacter baidiensis TaxID=1723361 RepID=UPI003D7FCC4B